MIYVKRLSDELSCDMTFTPCKIVRVLWKTEAGDEKSEICLSRRDDEERWIIYSEYIGSYCIRRNGVGTRVTNPILIASPYYAEIFDRLKVGDEREFTDKEWALIVIVPDAEQLELDL